MGLTIAQKILAKASGSSRVEPGDFVWARPDMATMPDLSAVERLKILKRLGLTTIWDPTKLIISTDHRVMVVTDREAQLSKEMRDLIREMGIVHFYDLGRHGIVHQQCVELGLVRPGMFVVGSDTHTPTCGGVGVLAVAVNHGLPILLATGEIWVMIPETIRVTLFEKLPQYGCARDIALTIGALIGSEEGNYRVIEFSGPGLDTLNLDQRLTLCNFAPEIGCKTAVAPPNEDILKYVSERSAEPFDPVLSDKDAEFVRDYNLDISSLEPTVACPPSPDNIKHASMLKDIEIDWAFIGSCAAGRMDDLRAAAAMLKGRKVNKRVKFFIVPASQEIYLHAIEEGLIKIFIESNAVVAPPSCGPCYGNMVHLANGETCIGTGTRNEPGRMGGMEAKVYIAGALVVTASAITGRITDPRKLMG